VATSSSPLNVHSSPSFIFILLALPCQVWFQDFPVKGNSTASPSSSSAAATSTSSPFEDDLVDYFCHYHFLRKGPPGKDSLVAALRRYDYSPACVALIPSVPGLSIKRKSHRVGNRTTFTFDTSKGPVEFCHPATDINR
jgi:hypothetical protein